MKKLYICFTLLFMTAGYGQTPAQREWIRNHYDLNYLNEMAGEYEARQKSEKEYAYRQADIYSWPKAYTDKDGNYAELIRVLNDTVPVYYTSNSNNAGISTRTNFLHSGGLTGLNLNGENMYMAFWDQHLARITHQEFESRIVAGDNIINQSDHASHVGGIIFSAGDPNTDAQGMAPEATGTTYHWDDDQFETIVEGAAGLLVSNHSYGTLFSSVPDVYIGDYTDDCRHWDHICYYAPYLLVVTAAGNDAGGYNSEAMPGSGFLYDKLTGFKCAKNPLVVANAENIVLDNNGDFVSASMHITSSPGPTDDLRIKPDIAGHGTGVESCGSSSDTHYYTNSGTSMASPNVAGSLLLLQQLCMNLHVNPMRAATLKGLALHTADDIAPTGPDARSGWGLLNARDAAVTMLDNGSYSIISEEVLENTETYTIDVYSDGVNPLSVSLSWTDRHVFENDGPPANNTTPVLLNNLNLRVLQGLDVFEPYLLTSPTSFTTGTNNVDPYERVDIPVAEGTYTIEVTHTGTLYYEVPQAFSLIVTGLTLCSAEDEDITVTTTFTSGEDIHRHAQETITATNTINTGADVHFLAGDYVALNDGFIADNGSLFLADIGDCGGSFEPSFTGEEELPRRPMPQDRPLAENLKALTLYPNPADTSVDIKLHNGSFAKVTLYSIDGKQVLAQGAAGTEYRLDISSLEGGIYLVVAETASGEKYNEKLIVD